jgi:hypothetical protein
MAFDISRFNSEATGYGFLRPSHFLAAIPQPPKWYTGNTRFLSYLCSGLNLPGTVILTSEERNIGYGPSRKIPYDMAHNDVTLTFYADGNAETLAFFDQWMRNTVAFGNPDGNNPISGASFGEVQYPANYETQMQFYVYNENPGDGDADNLIEIVKYTLDRAYPVSMSDIQMDWANGEAIQTFQVTFTFRTFWIEKNNARKYGTGVGPAITRAQDYLNNARGGNLFNSENEFARYAMEYSQSTNPGFIGLPFVDQIVGIVSGAYSSVTDKLTVLNGYASKINGQLNSIGALASLGKSTQISVPQVPTVRFP